MQLDELMEKNRRNELLAIYRFINTASVDEVACIISEIRVVHDNILVFHEEHKSLLPVDSVSINGYCIQLNINFLNQKPEEKE